MTKQIIRNINKCFECPFLEWDYNSKGDTYNYCTNNKFNQSETIQIINDIGGVPDWCPLPDKKID